MDRRLEDRPRSSYHQKLEGGWLRCFMVRRKHQQGGATFVVVDPKRYQGGVEKSAGDTFPSQFFPNPISVFTTAMRILGILRVSHTLAMRNSIV